MNKWARDYKKYLKNRDRDLEELEDFYNYKDRQDKLFWVILILLSAFIGMITSMLFI